MLIVKIKCQCGRWIRIRTKEDKDGTRCWNCASYVEVSRRGGKGARIEGKVKGRVVKSSDIDVEYEE